MSTAGRYLGRSHLESRIRLLSRSPLIADMFGRNLACVITTNFVGEPGASGSTKEILFFCATLPRWLVVAYVRGRSVGSTSVRRCARRSSCSARECRPQGHEGTRALPVRTGESDVEMDAVPIVRMLPPADGAHDRGGDVAPRPDEEHALPRMLVVAAAAFALVLTSNLLSLGLDDLRTTLINANWEFSWSHDVDTILLGVCACTSLVGARGSRRIADCGLPTVGDPRSCSSWMRYRRFTGRSAT